jgi:hypothetical protein
MVISGRLLWWEGVMAVRSVLRGRRGLILVFSALLMGCPESPAPPPPEAKSPDPCAPLGTCPNDASAPLPGSGTPADEPLTGEDWASTDELDVEGPRFAASQALGRFEAQGYVCAGWPIVVDLETRPGTMTWLEIRGEGLSEPLASVTIEGEGRRTRVVELPYWENEGAQVARFRIVSASMVAGNAPVPEPVRVYAFGAGPYAVGSTTLDVTSFLPAQASSAEQVNYSLLARRFYQRSVVEVLRLPPPGGKQLTRVVRKEISPLSQGPSKGNWGSLGGPRAVPKGVYQLQARAWRVAGGSNDREWTGAIGAKYVIVR